MKLISKHINIICRKLGMNSEVEHMADGVYRKEKVRRKRYKLDPMYGWHFLHEALLQ